MYQYKGRFMLSQNNCWAGLLDFQALCTVSWLGAVTARWICFLLAGHSLSAHQGDGCSAHLSRKQQETPDTLQECRQPQMSVALARFSQNIFVV